MRVIETLALGGRRQLQLVSCGRERFLVAGGAESIHAIVRVKTVTDCRNQPVESA